MLNSLKYVKRLEEVGLTREQAEAQVEMVTEITEKHFATREDIADVRRDISDLRTELRGETKALRADMATFKAEVRAEIDGLRKEMDHRFVVMEQRLVIKLGVMMASMMSVGAALTTALVKLL